MVNFKLANEMRKVPELINMTRAWTKKKSESSTGIEPMIQATWAIDYKK